MRVALTGASGYLGRHLVACLGSPEIIPRDKSPITADVVIHAAAAVPKSPEEYHDEDKAAATICMTLDLLRRLDDGCRRLIVVSSLVAAGPVPNAYGWGKLAAEWLAMGALNEQFIRELLIVRLPGLFGPPRRSGTIYTTLRDSGACEPDWPVMHVEAAASLIQKLVYETVTEDLSIYHALGAEGDELKRQLASYAEWIHDHHC